MAKAAWVTVTPTSGKGNGTTNISATAHTGRAARSTLVTVQNQSGAKPSKAITVNQAAKAALFTCADKTIDLPSSGGVFSVTGTSNSKVIQFNDNDGILDEIKIKINGVPDTSWVAEVGSLTNDPGANAQYTFEITGQVLNNVLAGTIEGSVGVSGWNDNVQAGSTANVIFRVAGVPSSLSTDKASISLLESGAIQNLAITSNDNWLIS